MQFNIPWPRWKSTDYKIPVQAPVADLTRARQLAQDEPAPLGGTEIIGEGSLRLFVPDKFINVGEIRFTSGSVFSARTETDYSSVDGNILACTRPGDRNDELHVFRGEPSQCHALLRKIKDNQRLTSDSINQGFKTAKHNTAFAAASFGTFAVLAGCAVGGPAGAAFATVFAGAMGSIVGGVSGIQQAIALSNANEDEQALEKALRAWLAYTDPSAANGRIDTTAAKMHFEALRDQRAFKKTKPPSIQYVVLQCFIRQIETRLLAGLVTAEQASDGGDPERTSREPLTAIRTSTGVQLIAHQQMGNPLQSQELVRFRQATTSRGS